jgi:exodeoxyribonuclease-3
MLPSRQPPAIEAMRVATWNVNSLKVRLRQLLDWLAVQPVDIVGIQETKLVDDAFPYAELRAAGFEAVHNGQKTYNGVALLSRRPLEDVARDMPGFDCEQRRVITATVGDLRVVNVYVVNGQAVGSDKYAHKLRFLAALRDYLAAELQRHPNLVVTGDFNIAPTPQDTHDPQLWEGRILCSEPEREGLRALLGLGLKDAFRLFEQPPASYTWWDYRQAAFRRNMGLRIDHILLSPALAARCSRCWIDVAPRKLERPSDHAPLVVELGESSAN